MSKKLTQEEFISKAIIVHGDKYIYPSTYVGSKHKIEILCKLHGSFYMTPNDHLSGKGCKQCGIENRCKKQKHSILYVKERIKDAHNGFISLAFEQEYISSHASLIFKCGSNHVWKSSFHSVVTKKRTCPYCSGKVPHTWESLNDKVKSLHNNEIVLTQNQHIHGMINKYEFQHLLCGYTWLAKAHNVTSNLSGCPKCTHRFTDDVMSSFYILSINGEHSFTGFGITNIWRKRRTQHKKNLKSNRCSIQYEILIESDGKTIQALEQYVKETLHCNNSNIVGFKTESVLISPEELKIFCENYLQKECASYKIVVNR